MIKPFTRRVLASLDPRRTTRMEPPSRLQVFFSYVRCVHVGSSFFTYLYSTIPAATTRPPHSAVVSATAYVHTFFFDEALAIYRGVPPYTMTDNIAEHGLCYICKTYHPATWTKLYNHVRLTHNIPASVLQHTPLHRLYRQECREKEKAKYHKKKNPHGSADEGSMT